MNCFALKKRAPLNAVITGVEVNVKADQLKGKIPGVCDARRLVLLRQGGVSGETEESLSVLLTFDVVSLPDKVMLVYPVQAFVPNTLHCYRCQVYHMPANQYSGPEQPSL